MSFPLRRARRRKATECNRGSDEGLVRSQALFRRTGHFVAAICGAALRGRRNRSCRRRATTARITSCNNCSAPRSRAAPDACGDSTGRHPSLPTCGGEPASPACGSPQAPFRRPASQPQSRCRSRRGGWGSGWVDCLAGPVEALAKVEGGGRRHPHHRRLQLVRGGAQELSAHQPVGDSASRSIKR
jgi:hypothetical protein